jgi:hypothetical protein
MPPAAEMGAQQDLQPEDRKPTEKGQRRAAEDGAQCDVQPMDRRKPAEKRQRRQGNPSGTPEPSVNRPANHRT